MFTTFAVARPSNTIVSKEVFRELPWNERLDWLKERYSEISSRTSSAEQQLSKFVALVRSECTDEETARLSSHFGDSVQFLALLADRRIRPSDEALCRKIYKVWGVWPWDLDVRLPQAMKRSLLDRLHHLAQQSSDYKKACGHLRDSIKYRTESDSGGKEFLGVARTAMHVLAWDVQKVIDGLEPELSQQPNITRGHGRQMPTPDCSRGSSPMRLVTPDNLRDLPPARGISSKVLETLSRPTRSPSDGNTSRNPPSLQSADHDHSFPKPASSDDGTHKDVGNPRHIPSSVTLRRSSRTKIRTATQSDIVNRTDYRSTSTSRDVLKRKAFEHDQVTSAKKKARTSIEQYDTQFYLGSQSPSLSQKLISSEDESSASPPSIGDGDLHEMPLDSVNGVGKNQSSVSGAEDAQSHLKLGSNSTSANHAKPLQDDTMVPPALDDYEDDDGDVDDNDDDDDDDYDAKSVASVEYGRNRLPRLSAGDSSIQESLEEVECDDDEYDDGKDLRPDERFDTLSSPVSLSYSCSSPRSVENLLSHELDGTSEYPETSHMKVESGEKTVCWTRDDARQAPVRTPQGIPDDYFKEGGGDYEVAEPVLKDMRAKRDYESVLSIIHEDEDEHLNANEPPGQLSQTLLDSLGKGSWLKSTVVDSSLEMAMNVNVLLLVGETLDRKSIKQPNIRLRTHHSMMIGPMHHTDPSPHWTLCALDLSNGNVGFYNSIAKDPRYAIEAEARLQQFCQALSKRYPRLRTLIWRFRSEPTPQQCNSNDCGVHAIVIGLHLILGLPVPSAIPAGLWRIILKSALGITPLRQQAEEVMTATKISIIPRNEQDLEASGLQALSEQLTLLHKQVTEAQDVGNIVRQALDSCSVQREMFSQEISKRTEFLESMQATAQNWKKSVEDSSIQDEMDILLASTRATAVELQKKLDRLLYVDTRLRSVRLKWEAAQETISAARLKAVGIKGAKLPVLQAALGQEQARLTACKEKLAAERAERLRAQDEREHEELERLQNQQREQREAAEAQFDIERAAVSEKEALLEKLILIGSVAD